MNTAQMFKLILLNSYDTSSIIHGLKQNLLSYEANKDIALSTNQPRGEMNQI